VAGLDARGFIIGSVLAYELGVGFVPIRKKGKLPFTTVEETYELEYGSATVEMHTDAVRPGDRVVLIDDLIATGGTMMAGKKLLERWAPGDRRRGHRRPARAGRLATAARGRAAAVHAGRLRRALTRGRAVSLPDAEAAEDLAQQLVGGHRAGDLAERVVGLPQVFGQQVQLTIARTGMGLRLLQPTCAAARRRGARVR
jgi:hypothetical protein